MIFIEGFVKCRLVSRVDTLAKPPSHENTRAWCKQVLPRRGAPQGGEEARFFPFLSGLVNQRKRRGGRTDHGVV